MRHTNLGPNTPSSCSPVLRMLIIELLQKRPVAQGVLRYGCLSATAVYARPSD